MKILIAEYIKDGGSAMVVDSELNVISLGGDVTQFMNLYSKTKNLCIPIVIHILINSFGVMFMLLTYQ